MDPQLTFTATTALTSTIGFLLAGLGALGGASVLVPFVSNRILPKMKETHLADFLPFEGIAPDGQTVMLKNESVARYYYITGKDQAFLTSEEALSAARLRKDFLDGLSELGVVVRIFMMRRKMSLPPSEGFPNEMARHKLLDMVGDLALIGRPIKAQILAARPGHAANIAFAKKIKKLMLKNAANQVPRYDPTQPPVLDINRISQLLPHRYPFQMVDKIIALDEKSVVGIKNVTMNEPFFPGHFPGNPVMPGVMQLEAMAQTGGILVLSTVPDPENYWPFLVGIENCRFRRNVLPGDTVIFRCEFTTPMKRGIVKMSGRGYVNDQLVCEAEMIASLVKKKL